MLLIYLNFKYHPITKLPLLSLPLRRGVNGVSDLRGLLSNLNLMKISRERYVPLPHIARITRNRAGSASRRMWKLAWHSQDGSECRLPGAHAR